MATIPDADHSTSVADGLATRLVEGLPVTHRRLDVAGISTSVLQGGKGPPIVLLHGQAAFAESWGGVIRSLVGSHHVVAPDLPGLGRSQVRTGSLDGSRVIAWLDDLIAQTCSEPPALVGISLGGTVSAHFAVEHGDRVRRIVLVASGSLGRFRPAPGALLALIRYMRRPSAGANARFFR
jgi:pimeloyl-ACP methyl ester carboxylesterase